MNTFSGVEGVPLNDDRRRIGMDRPEQHHSCVDHNVDAAHRHLIHKMRVPVAGFSGRLSQQQVDGQLHHVGQRIVGAGREVARAGELALAQPRELVVGFIVAMRAALMYGVGLVVNQGCPLPHCARIDHQ